MLVVPQGFKPLLSPNICQHLSTISTILLGKCTEGMDLTISIGQGTRPARQICLAVKVCKKILNLVMSLVLMSGGWKVWKLKAKRLQSQGLLSFVDSVSEGSRSCASQMMNVALRPQPLFSRAMAA